MKNKIMAGSRKYKQGNSFLKNNWGWLVFAGLLIIGIIWNHYNLPVFNLN